MAGPGELLGTVSLCTSYAYNADGEKTSMTDANGKTTDYGYSPLRELTSSTDPNSRDTTYTYDAVGNKLTMTDPDGDETTSSKTQRTTHLGDQGLRHAHIRHPLLRLDADGNKAAMRTAPTTPRRTVTTPSTS